MATGIDVLLSGMMLICLNGQSNCPVGEYHPNTANVVKADYLTKPCGWQSAVTTRTTLELRFNTDEFYYPASAQGKWVNTQCNPNSNNRKEIICPIEEARICINPMPESQEKRLLTSLQWLPRIDEVDVRFRSVSLERVRDRYYVPTRIHFPTGVIGAGPRWPPSTGNIQSSPRIWYRSNLITGGALPRELSDRVEVRYERAGWIELTSCDGDLLLMLTRKPNAPKAEVKLWNRADVLQPETVYHYEDLAYLLWYYRLGLWGDTLGPCPEYSEDRRDAVLLRCLERGCSFYDQPAADNRFWPPMLRSGY